jgi:hypothetical protein
MNMNSRNSRRGLSAFAAVGLAAFAALLGGSGCTNHGPVNLFAPELFHKNVAGANLAFYTASSITQTVYAIGSGHTSGNCACEADGSGGYLDLSVVLVNNGSSSTYGPVQVVFSGDQYFFPRPTYNGQAVAVSTFGSGTEIAANSQTQVSLDQGYASGSGYNLFLNGSGGSNGQPNTYWYSLQFAYTPPAGSTPVASGTNPNLIPETITMLITDGVGETFSSSFTLYMNYLD